MESTVVSSLSENKRTWYELGICGFCWKEMKLLFFYSTALAHVGFKANNVYTGFCSLVLILTYKTNIYVLARHLIRSTLNDETLGPGILYLDIIQTDCTRNSSLFYNNIYINTLTIRKSYNALPIHWFYRYHFTYLSYMLMTTWVSYNHLPIFHEKNRNPIGLQPLSLATSSILKEDDDISTRSAVLPIVNPRAKSFLIPPYRWLDWSLT